jgi:hypothetical protein
MPGGDIAMQDLKSPAKLGELNMEQRAEVIGFDYTRSEKLKGYLYASTSCLDPGPITQRENKSSQIRNSSPDLPNEWGPEK